MNVQIEPTDIQICEECGSKGGAYDDLPSNLRLTTILIANQCVVAVLCKPCRRILGGKLSHIDSV